MRLPDQWGPAGAATLVTLTLAVGAAVTLPQPGTNGPEPASMQMLDAVTLERALSSTVPPRPTMSDEIEHFEARAAERGGESFSLERLFRARMLAYRAYGDAQHLSGAAEVVDRLSEPGQGSPATLRSASSLHLARHEFGAALTAARELDGLSGDEASTYSLFDAMWAVGAREEARGLLERPLDTLSWGYLSRSARVLDADGLVDHARARFSLVVERVRAYAEPIPVRAWALVESGHFELHSGRPEEAVRRYEEALDILPGSPAAIEGLASVSYGVDGNLESARALYRKALDNGGHLDLLPVLAEVEEALGNLTEASALRRDFIARAAGDGASERMYRRPLIFLLAENRETLEEALRLARADLAERKDPGAFDALAWVLYRRGEVRTAWTLMERAVSLGAPPPPLAFRAGVIAAAAGENDQARRLLAQALEGRVELARHQIRRAQEALARIG